MYNEDKVLKKVWIKYSNEISAPYPSFKQRVLITRAMKIYGVLAHKHLLQKEPPKEEPLQVGYFGATFAIIIILLLILT